MTDISREMVEHLCHIHRGYEQHGTVAMLIALRAALDAAEANINIKADWIDATINDMAQGEQDAAEMAAPSDKIAEAARVVTVREALRVLLDNDDEGVIDLKASTVVDLAKTLRTFIGNAGKGETP